MSQQLEECTRLLFANEYEKQLAYFASELGSIIVNYYEKRTLTSSPGLGAIYRLATPIARELSNQRLKIDLEVLNNLGLSIKEHEEWLKSNQQDLLLHNFWKQFILSTYEKPVFQGSSTLSISENQIFTELQNILNQVHREIQVKSMLSAEQQPAATQSQTVINVHAPSQINSANGQATITATQTINIGAQIEEVAKLLLVHLKASDIDDGLKTGTIELVETTVEQIKDNKPKQTIIKSLMENLKSIATAITTTDKTIQSSGNLLGYITKLNDLLQPFVS